jgi:hypothetical protein
MKKISLLVAVAVLATFVVAAPAAAAKPGSTAFNLPVTGSFTDALNGVGTFDGNLRLTRIANIDGELTAITRLTGTITNSMDEVVGTVSQQLLIPIGSLNATCDILHLELGPLDLDLLGLMVHLDQVVLDITAEQGPGNLLGNLLCAVAGLLDDGGLNLDRIAQLLNRILGILG